jgi:ABC-type dipeptide/oligopeptide/nickel transport system permease subunit
VVAVNGTLKMADAILTYVAVAFLGLSVPPPATGGGLLTTGIDGLSGPPSPRGRVSAGFSLCKVL